MTDSTQWQSPAGSSQPQQPGAHFQAPGQQGVPTVPPVAGAPGWTPPPKPGLIPLRPLTLGTILSAAFQVMRRNPKPTFGFSLLLNGIIGLISVIVVGVVAVLSFTRVFNATGSNSDEIAAGAIGQVYLSALVPLLLALVSTAVLQGIISLEVARGTVGERLTLGGLWRMAKGRIGTLVLWALLIIGAAVVVLIVLGLVIGLFAAFGGNEGIAVAVVLFLVSYAGVAVLTAWLGTRLSLVPSSIMIERLPLRQAMRRSWSLTIGYFWKTFGIQLLVGFIVGVVSQVVSLPLSFIAPIGMTLLNPTGDNTGLIVTLIIVTALTLLIALVFGAITAIIQSATAALIYLDLRMRKEGLDLELTRFVEARQAGDTTVADPYLIRGIAHQPPAQYTPPGATSYPSPTTPTATPSAPPSESPWA